MTSSPAVADFALAGALLLYLVVFAAAGLRRARRPVWARLLALWTLVQAVVVAVVGAGLLRQGGPWAWQHWAVLLAAVAVLVGTAYQWAPVWFRSTAAVVGVLVLGVTCSVGLDLLEEERAVSARTDVTRLDIELAGVALSGEVLEQQASSVQDSVAVACDEAGGSLEGPQSEADGTDPGEPWSQPQACVPEEASDGEASEAGADASEADASEADTGRPAVAVSLARADLALARLAAAADPGDESTAAVDEAAAAAAEAENAEGEHRPTPTDVGSALVAGAEGAVAEVGRALTDRPWHLPTAGWLVLAVLLVLFHRMLEVVNDGLGPGPVVLPLDGADGQADLRDELRHHLITNLPEPGTQPGKAAASSITDLAALDPRSAWVKPVIGLLNVLGLPPRGFELAVSASAAAGRSEQDAAGSAPGTAVPATTDDAGTVMVTVVVKSARNGRTRHVVTAEGDTRSDAVVKAAYETTAWVLARARSVPPWMQWSPSAGVAYHRFMSLEAARRRGPGRALEALRRVAREAPGNAQVQVALGFERDLAGDVQGARAAYELAARMWPDYTLAQYRTAVALANLADDEIGAPDGATASALRLEACRRYRLVGRALTWWFPLRKLSIRERHQASEWSRARNTAWALYLAAWANDARGVALAEPERRTLRRRMRRAERTRGAVVQYNLACLRLALADDAGAGYLAEAEADLDRVLVCPDADRVSGAWLLVDPDLARVRPKAREVAGQLPEVERTR